MKDHKEDAKCAAEQLMPPVNGAKQPSDGNLDNKKKKLAIAKLKLTKKKSSK